MLQHTFHFTATTANSILEKSMMISFTKLVRTAGDALLMICLMHSHMNKQCCMNTFYQAVHLSYAGAEK